MTQQTLSASASSVLLLDEENQELTFEVAKGEAGKHLKNIRLNENSGIAGWVVQNHKPAIINDVSKNEHFNRDIDRFTSFQTRSIICAPLMVHSRCIGAIEVLNKIDGSDFSAHDLEALVSVASTAAISIENLRLNQTILESYKSTVRALVAAIDAKDPYTCGHSQRVTEHAMMGARALSFSRQELEDLEYGGILHDIGKIGISDSILAKTGPLDSSEWDIIRQHPLIGAKMIDDIPFLEKARDMVLQHHERYDGKGYPHGIPGNEMPMGARLLAVADAFDAMTTDRPYRSALGIDFAINELRRSAGTQLCPEAVKGFISGLQTKRYTAHQKKLR
jgi:putative nucleotidyltransferase with HDIG domain